MVSYKLAFWTLNTVLGTAATTLFHTLTVQSATDDVITNTRKVLYAASANENNRVLLKVVPFIGNIGDYFGAIGKTNLGYLTDSRIRLFRRTSHYLDTDPAFKGIRVEGGRFGLNPLWATSFAN